MPDTPSTIHGALFVLFVSDQDAATRLYGAALDASPILEVPGMTKFALPGSAELGLMPETGIAAILPTLDPPASRGRGVARSELYLTVQDPAEAHRRAVAAGALEVSPLAPRSWGDEAAYSQCPDGHLLIFARPLGEGA